MRDRAGRHIGRQRQGDRDRATERKWREREREGGEWVRDRSGDGETHRATETGGQREGGKEADDRAYTESQH